LVRNTAVETRLKWFVVGTMEEEASKKWIGAVSSNKV
jgi:hypothetical protein